MPTLTSNMWKGDVNTKVPALSHYFTFRVTGANFAQSATTVFNLPGNYNLLGQYTPAQAPANFAQTSSPYDVNSEPQFQGAVFVPTHMDVRNPNGTFVSSGTGAAGTATIALFNPNVASINTLTGAVTRTAGSAANSVNQYMSIQWTASTTGNQIWSQEAVWEDAVSANSITTGTPALGANPTLVQVPVAETPASAPGFIAAPVRFGLGDSLAINVATAGYVAGSTLAATATQFTVDVFGYWLQGF